MYRNEVELAGKKMIGIRHMVECVGSRNHEEGKLENFLNLQYYTVLQQQLPNFEFTACPGSDRIVTLL